MRRRAGTGTVTRVVVGCLVVLAIVGYLVSRLGSHEGNSALERRDGGGTVAAAALPPQARATLARIDAGGPFPYRQDGVVFGNREGRLPRQPGGYYHEYTVPTPGSSDRGARRLVTGRQGEVWYSPDHYRSFLRVRR
ncbi:MAG: ribonuclease domain-containing protein [Mycobacteriales bacterium]